MAEIKESEGSKARASEVFAKLQRIPKYWDHKRMQNRVCIREGILFEEDERKLKPRYCFLFNDSFIVTKPVCDFTDNDTKLMDTNTNFKYKHHYSLTSLYIEETPFLINQQSKTNHKSKVMYLIGNNPDTTKKITLQKTLLSHTNNDIILAWIKDIHKYICNIYKKTNTDMIKYAWQNDYNRGTIFHSVMTLDNKLFDKLINDDIKSIDLKSKDTGGHNLFHIACANNNLEWIKKYHENLTDIIDEKDNNGWSAFRIACDNDNFSIVEYMINELFPDYDEYYPQNKLINPVISKQNNPMDDRTILHEMVSRNQVKIVELLVKNGSNLEAIDIDGRTPLHLAAQKNHEECAVILLMNGAPPNATDYKGNTPLHLNNKIQTGRWIIGCGGRIDVMNRLNKPSSMGYGDKNLDRFVQISQMFTSEHAKVQTIKGDMSDGWISDETSQECLYCKSKFGMFNRKHHCRICGILLCGACSTKKLKCVKGTEISFQRTCDKCFNKALNDMEMEKIFEFNETKHKMVPNKFLRMVLYERTKKGSYQEYLDNLNKPTESKDEFLLIEANDVKDQHTFVELKQHGPSKSVSDAETLNPKAKPHNKRKSLMADFFSTKKRNNDLPQNNGLNKQQNDGINQARDNIAQANAQAAINLQKTKELEDKSYQLRNQAADFNALAKKLAQKKW